jgi:hypothetical protein
LSVGGGNFTKCVLLDGKIFLVKWKFKESTLQQKIFTSMDDFWRPRRSATPLYGIKSDFVKGNCNLSGLFVGHIIIADHSDWLEGV